jgi:large subunit ribosomal protein L15
MNELSNLKPPKGSKKGIKRVGRGEASGWGKTSGRGHKGLRARSGGRANPGYEGGQMPLIRRLPKVGFQSLNRKDYALVTLADLAQFAAGEVVGPDRLREAGLYKGRKLAGVKILANGEIGVALTVQAHKFSKVAKEKIEAAGGKAEVL